MTSRLRRWSVDLFRWAFRRRPCWRRQLVRCFSRCRRLNRLSDCRCQHPTRSLRTRNWSDHPTGQYRVPLLLVLLLVSKLLLLPKPLLWAQLHRNPENRAAPPPVLQQPAGPTLSLVRQRGAAAGGVGCGRASLTGGGRRTNHRDGGQTMSPLHHSRIT